MDRILTADEIAEISDERDRYRAALEKIVGRWQRNHESWRPGGRPDGPGKSWADGFHTGLATVHEEATAALDPDGHRVTREQLRAARGTDREWFEATVNCGGCGYVASRCDCAPSDPCGCGPHDLEPWPRKCWACKGSGETPKPAWWDEEGRP